MFRFVGIFLTGLVLCAGSVSAQQYLVLEKAGTVRNFKYQVNDEIFLQLKREGAWITGRISELHDSSLVIDSYIDVKLSEIAVVRRSSSFISRLSKLFFIRGGIAYFLIVGTNRAINQEYPVVDQFTTIVSGSMILAGILLRPLISRDFELGQKWRLKVLDFTLFE